MRRPPTVYFSFRSPYSWLAIDRARRSVPDLFTRVSFVPYWEPDADMVRRLALRGAELPYVPMSRAKHRYILMDTRRIARAEGHALCWPVDVDPNWEVSHLAWLAAAAEGSAEPLYDAICGARWREGKDIGRPEVVRAAAIASGLSPALAEVHTSSSVRELGVDALERAWKDDVFGVPYFRIGRDRFWGFDRVELFVEALGGRAEPDPAVAEVAPQASALDSDTAGGCG